ncbi:MAG: hypothetical protein Q8R43_02820, partial [Alphaproteobacteria bacterium]|nr:hypothetical protein [Alphaproteobacteria bacterium]
MKIKLKLPLFILACTLITAIAIGFQALTSSKESIKYFIDDRADGLLREKKIQLTGLFESVEAEIKFIAKAPAALKAFEGFVNAWVVEGLNTNSLQNIYIHKNPNPAGKKHLLLDGLDGSKYSELHKEFHPWFRRYLEKDGYYDIFLI